MALKCLLAIVAVGLLIIGALATGVAALSLSARFFVAWTGTAIPFRTSAAGGGEGPLDATGAFCRLHARAIQQYTHSGEFPGEE